MTWLVAHMWLALLLAALFGGLIGWAFRHVWKRETADGNVPNRAARATAGVGEAGARIAELEAQLHAERDEVANLKGRARLSPDGQTDDAEVEEGTLEWRNRYLESRVRFLEKQLADAEEAQAEPPTPVAGEEDEATRLLWRNRYLEGRVRYLEDELVKGGSLNVAPVETTKSKAGTTGQTGTKPLTLDQPRNGRADNLKKIGGVGPKIEKLLNGLGVFHFEQVAAWTDQEIAWVNAEVSFKGRIEREKWVDQAKSLAKGLQPEAKTR